MLAPDAACRGHFSARWPRGRRGGSRRRSRGERLLDAATRTRRQTGRDACGHAGRRHSGPGQSLGAAAQPPVRGEPPALRRPCRHGGCLDPRTAGRDRRRSPGSVRAVGPGASAVHLRVPRRADHRVGLSVVPAGTGGPDSVARDRRDDQCRLRRVSRLACSRRKGGGPRRDRGALPHRPTTGTAQRLARGHLPRGAPGGSVGRPGSRRMALRRRALGCVPVYPMVGPRARHRVLGSDHVLLARRNAGDRADHGRLSRHRRARRPAAQLSRDPAGRARRARCAREPLRAAGVAGWRGGARGGLRTGPSPAGAVLPPRVRPCRSGTYWSRRERSGRCCRGWPCWAWRSGCWPSGIRWGRPVAARAGRSPRCVWLGLASDTIRYPSPDGGGGLALHFLDVGQGDGAALRTPGGRWLVIDAGPADERRDAGRRVVAPFLERQGVGSLAAIIVSHAHADHMGGVPALLGRFPVGLLLEPGAPVADPAYAALLTALDRDSVAWHPARAGENFTLDGVRFSVLHPEAGWRRVGRGRERGFGGAPGGVRRLPGALHRRRGVSSREPSARAAGAGGSAQGGPPRQPWQYR